MPRLRKLTVHRPRRHHLILAAVVVALAGCGWATVARGPFDGLILLAALGGLILGLYLMPTRPHLAVKVQTPDGPADRISLDPGSSACPIDKEAVIAEEVRAARATMPRPPKSALPPTPLGAAIAVANQGVLGSFASEEELEKFIKQVQRYGAELDEWLDELDHARSLRTRRFAGTARVFESGEAPADHARLRLIFPAGFEPIEESPWVDDPPDRPDFSPPLLPALGAYRVPRIPRVDPISLAPSATYRREGETTVVEFDLGRVNQGDFRDSPEFELLAGPAGVHHVSWEVSCSGLRRPARGVWTVRVDTPGAGPTITTLVEARAERERFDLN
jgi:hypothetical protein